MYFTIYFLMTGLHGLHVLIGMSVLGWVAWRAGRGEFGPGYSTPVELSGLYWHLVDLILDLPLPAALPDVRMRP